MQPTTAPVATTQRTTIVAQSPAGHQLLEALAAIRAEFQANAASAALPEGAIVLPALGNASRAMYRAEHGDGERVLEIADDAGNEDSYRCHRFCPDGWRPHWHHPAWWSLGRARKDAKGLTWLSQDATFVMDDFGMLVEVPQ